MNIFIDFDHTLFNTHLLTENMLQSIATSICQQRTDLTYEIILQILKDNFKRPDPNDSKNTMQTYNIYELATKFASHYGLIPDSIIDPLNLTILKGKNYVFTDAVEFLETLKKEKHQLFILTTCPDIDYQNVKVTGSGLAPYFDAGFYTTTHKWEYPINYTDGIFIDDNPKDLIGLLSKVKDPSRLLRIRRENQKYADKDTENPQIREFKSLLDMLPRILELSNSLNFGN